MYFMPDFVQDAMYDHMILSETPWASYHYSHKGNISVSYCERIIINWDLNRYLSDFKHNYILKCCANTSLFTLYFTQIGYAEIEQKEFKSLVPAICWTGKLGPFTLNPTCTMVPNKPKKTAIHLTNKYHLNDIVKLSPTIPEQLHSWDYL